MIIRLEREEVKTIQSWVFWVFTLHSFHLVLRFFGFQEKSHLKSRGAPDPWSPSTLPRPLSFLALPVHNKSMWDDDFIQVVLIVSGDTEEVQFVALLVISDL